MQPSEIQSAHDSTAKSGARSDHIKLIRSVLRPPLLRSVAEKLDLVLLKIRTRREAGGDAAVSKLIGTEQRFVSTASSVTLGAALSGEDVELLLQATRESPAKNWIRHTLGGPAACDLDQAWARRQYAPANYPPLHAPHGWHQDGALGFDFLSCPDGNYPADALLPMVTCWIALDPCGLEAPGLELMTTSLTQLLRPAELTGFRVRERFPANRFWHPTMQPGDALLFTGDILHRTYVVPAMNRDRTSIEVRFFQGNDFPARLKADHFLRL